LEKNTVIIFTSDNGYFLGDRQLSDKFFMYEESLRVPLIVCDPRESRKDNGRREKAMTLNIDLAPTMLALAGIKEPQSMQGQSLVPLLENKHPKDWRTEFFYEHHTRPDIIPPSEGVRTGRWVYIRWINENPVLEELFDLKSDSLEAHNVAGDVANRKILSQLQAKWSKYQAELK
jgi:arylsulfatase A-like enzyme